MSLHGLQFNPKSEDLLKIKSLLKNYKSSDNSAHLELTKSLLENGRSYDYHCYLLEIFNKRSNDVEIRQLSGILIKNYFESLMKNQISTVFLKHFIKCGLDCLNDDNNIIRNTLSFMLSSFSKVQGVNHWQDFPKILIENLLTKNPKFFQSFLETVSYIIEDSAAILLQSLEGKKFIIHLIKKVKEVIIVSCQGVEYSQDVIVNVLKIIKNLIKKSINNIFFTHYIGLEHDLVNLNMVYTQNYTIREKIGKIWLKIFKNDDKNVLVKEFRYFIDMFRSFLEVSESVIMISTSNSPSTRYNSAYDLNLCACQFFHFIIVENEYFQKYATSNEDDNFKMEIVRLINIFTKKISLRYGTKEIFDEMDEENLINIDDLVNTSVRHSSALILQYLAWISPESFFNTTKEAFEQGLNSSDIFEKERSLYFLSWTGAYWLATFVNFPPIYSVNLISFLLNLFNTQNDSKIIKLATLSSLSRISFSLIKELEANRPEFMEGLCSLFRNICHFIQGDDEKLQLTSAHFILTLLNDTAKYIAALDSVDLMTERFLPFINYTIEQICLCLAPEKKHKYKLVVKLKICDIFENLMDNYSGVLDKCENFPKFISFFQQESLMVSEEYIKSECSAIHLCAIMPKFIEIFFSCLINNSNQFLYNSTGNTQFSYILALFSHLTKMIKKSFQDAKSGKENTYNSEFFSIASDVLTIITQYSFKNNYHEQTIVSIIDNHAIYAVYNMYANNFENIVHKYFQFYGSLAKYKNISILQKNINEILSFFYSTLENISYKNECFEKESDYILVASCVFALGDFVQNYCKLQKNYVAYILNAMIKFINRTTPSVIAESFVYAYGKIALIFPEEVSESFDECIEDYFRFINFFKLKDSEDKFLSIKGVMSIMMHRKNEYLDIFDLLSLCLISCENLPTDILRMYNILFSNYEKNNRTGLNEALNSLSDEEKNEIMTKLVK